MSLTGSIDSKSEKPMSLIWGCELSSERDSYTFQVPEEWRCEQQLALRTICLGEKARDEFHVVEIVPPEDGKPRAPVPLATLKPSVLPMATLVGVELTPPVTFHLRAGSGPVYISGQHISLMPDLSWEEEEEEEEDEEEELAEESPEKPPRGQAAKKGSAAKEQRRPRGAPSRQGARSRSRPGQEGSGEEVTWAAPCQGLAQERLETCCFLCSPPIKDLLLHSWLSVLGWGGGGGLQGCPPPWIPQPLCRAPRGPLRPSPTASGVPFGVWGGWGTCSSPLPASGVTSGG
ncbi:nucleoplasmin-2 isoform X1 [Cygnus olor]|uniref:nucleoplasmin-2 isoform X1 n=1 Tax=Cygnus olor TaxID=8869 RepID=UPI001ADDF3CE|nr:nucleoplasmin-2 isoform X1 [Cygnus olor]XP_040394474.1 nucleoplasmin-2 isoform X1 [Cygnus olor]XP_040394476.1 nucleoplasmin-2 isoform X1 [Cygnus olor]XP_040394477.1 nucleoplasmin-2 isoform X1 [Cygnus olor]